MDIGADKPKSRGERRRFPGRWAWGPSAAVAVDVYGDGTGTPRSIRLIGVQAMERTVYHPVVAKRRGECHALAATARVEELVRAGGGVVRMTAMHPGRASLGRPLRSIAVRIAGQKYWGLSAPVFGNPSFDNQANGDGGYLFDPKGDLRAWHLYPCVTACPAAAGQVLAA